MRHRLLEKSSTKLHPALIGDVVDHRDPRSGHYGGHYCFFSPEDDETLLSVIFDGCAGRGVKTSYGYRVEAYTDGLISAPCVTVEVA